MMNQRLKQLLDYWIIGLLVLGGLSGLVLVFEEAGAYTQRGTIVIEGDAAFNVGNGVSDGSGTNVDPYIIDGWEIDGGGEGRCIFVANTTKHFVLRNCNLTNASGNNVQYYRNAGISIYNSTNFTIENCVFGGNGHGIYLETSSGFLISGNQFESNDHGIYVYTKEEGLDRDHTIMDIEIRDNEFEMISSNDAVYFYIELDYNSNSGHDAEIGNIDISDNDFFMNGTSADGIHIQDIDVFELVDGSIDMGDVTMSGNRIFGGSQGIYFDGYFYYYTNVTLNVGDVTMTDNTLMGQSTTGIYMNYYDVEDMYGTTRAVLGDLIITGNSLISNENNVNGIYMNDYAYWAYFTETAGIVVGDLIVEENVIDVDEYGIYVYYSYAAFDMKDDTSVIMGNASIRNNTIFNSSYGIYFDYSWVAYEMVDNALANFGDIAIIDNLINSSSDAIHFDYYEVSYDMNDNTISVFGDIIISDNRLDAMSKGISFDEYEYCGNEMEKFSTFLLGGITITRNQIDSRNSAIYLYYDYFGYVMHNEASMSMGDITIFDNQLHSDISETIYLYVDDSARNLFNESTVIMGNISVVNNTINSSTKDGLSVEYSCGGVGSSMEGDSYARLPAYSITGNTFNAVREGILFDLYYMGNDNHDDTAVDIGGILIDDNTFTDGTHGVDISIYEILEGHNSSMVTMEGITISRNDFSNLTDDAIYLFFDEFGYGFDANEVLILGDVRIEDNFIDGCDDGIYIDYAGLYSEAYANVTIGELSILDNVIRDCASFGISAIHELDARDYSTLTVENTTISGNIIMNCSRDGIFLHKHVSEEPFATALLASAFISDNEISNCTGSSSGIYLMDIEHSIVVDNVISECYIGIILELSHNTSILRNIARANRKAGLFIFSGNDNTVSLSSFTQNRYGVVIDPSENTVIHNSSIHNNTEFGVNASDNGGLLVDAGGNWWGSDTGPFHAVNNSGGEGDNVTGYTEIATWLTAPILIITSEDETAVLEDEKFSVRYEALDVDGNPVNWSLDTTAPWLSMDLVTGELSGTPTNDDVGDHTVNISVVDGFGGRDATEFILTVENTNDPPTITTDDVATVAEDSPYEVDYNATDIDPTEDVLAWSLNTTAAWLSLNASSGLLSGTPTNEEVGEYGINVSVSDGNGGVDWHNFTLAVTNVNDAPTITNADVINATEDELYYVHYEADDADPTNDTLSWSLDTDAEWLTLNESSTNLSGTPTNADVGAHWVNVSCSDDNNGTSWTNFTLTVANVNDAPSIVTANDGNATQYRLYRVDYEAIDIDPTNDTLTWKVETNASWLSMNSTTGMLRGTPTNVGSYQVKVTVEDGRGGAHSHDFTLDVAEGNSPPVVTTTALPDATEGEPYSYGLQFTDLEEDAVTWEIDTNAAWLAVDGATGILSGTPPMGSKGDYWVYVSLTDSHGNTVPLNLTLSVKESESSDIEPIAQVEVKTGEVQFLTYTDTATGTILDLKVSGNGILLAAKVEDDSDMVGEDPDGYGRISFYLQLTFTGEMEWTNITISFTDIVLNEALDYSEAKIFYYDGLIWKEAENTGLDYENRLVWANVSHFTIFAGFAPVKNEEDDDGEEGEEEAWYKGKGAITAIVIVLIVVVLVGVFLYVRSLREMDGEPEEEFEDVIEEDEEEDEEEEGGEESEVLEEGEDAEEVEDEEEVEEGELDEEGEVDEEVADEEEAEEEMEDLEEEPKDIDKSEDTGDVEDIEEKPKDIDEEEDTEDEGEEVEVDEGEPEAVPVESDDEKTEEVGGEPEGYAFEPKDEEVEVDEVEPEAEPVESDDEKTEEEVGESERDAVEPEAEVAEDVGGEPEAEPAEPTTESDDEELKEPDGELEQEMEELEKELVGFGEMEELGELVPLKELTEITAEPDDGLEIAELKKVS